MLKISWNPLAKQDYFDNIDFLLKKWSEREAQNFIDEVYEIEFLLKQGNVQFQRTNYPGVMRCYINQHISLFYRYSDKDSIEFLRFWNNHKNPANLSF